MASNNKPGQTWMASPSPLIMTAFFPKFSKTQEENEMNRKQELKQKLEELDRQILEAEKHLPAHSVKPPIMQEIFELEDQREAISAQLKELEGK
jgi:DNA repair exonuclease SbcCD ATPase subunit